MRGIVVYYSGTGNNHKIGQAIYRGMKEVIECDIASVNEIDPKDMANYDLIGIGSPIWYYRETANVRAFIYNMPDMTGKLCFMFTVHGTTPSGIFHSMVPPIQRKGLTIIAWNDWFGGNFYTLHGQKPYPLDGHPDAIDIQEAEDWGRKIADRAKRIYAGEKDLIPEIPHGKDADPLFQPHGVMTFFPGAEIPHRTVNMEKCLYPKCTMCIDNCVAHSLDFSVDPPAFNRKTCINCCLCDRMCPQGAIEIPAEELYRMRTDSKIDMTKCKYPECTICVDHCSMKAIDFSLDPPIFKWSCEGDNLCWVICPEGAIEITNMDLTHRAMEQRISAGPAIQGRQRYNMLDQLEATGRFRRLIPKEELGSNGRIMNIERYPRFDINDLMQETPLPLYYGRPYKKKDK